MSQFVVTRKMFFANSVGSDGQKGEYFKIALALVIKNLIEKMKALHVFCPSQGSNLIFMEEFFFQIFAAEVEGWELVAHAFITQVVPALCYQ